MRLLALFCLIMFHLHSPNLFAADADDSAAAEQEHTDKSTKKNQDQPAVNESVVAYKKAKRGKAKRQALLNLSGDETILFPLAIQALNDRSTKNAAISKLQQLSGLSPNKGEGGNPGYPGYPKSNTAGAWSNWYKQHKKKIDEKQELKDMKKKIDEQDKPTDETAEENGGEGEILTEDALGETAALNQQPQENVAYLGQLDRVIFTDGSLLKCYITVERHDLNGTLTSIHIVHRNNGGEEDIEAAIIARIEKDITQ